MIWNHLQEGVIFLFTATGLLHERKAEKRTWAKRAQTLNKQKINHQKMLGIGKVQKAIEVDEGVEFGKSSQGEVMIEDNTTTTSRRSLRKEVIGGN